MKEAKQELPKEMLEAFQRLESKIQKDAREREQAARDAELTLRERELRRRKRLERVTLAVTLTFSIFIAIAAWFTQGALRDSSSDVALTAANSPDALEGNGTASKIDCEDPRLKFTRYCVEKASSATTKSHWDNLSRGDLKVFTLHQKNADDLEAQKRKEKKEGQAR